jgi:hypothetical protein
MRIGVVVRPRDRGAGATIAALQSTLGVPAMNMTFKLSGVVAAALLALSSAYAQPMTKEAAKAEKDRIEESAKADKKACEPLKANAKDVCEAEAKAKEKIAKAELKWKESGKDGDRVNFEKMKAEGTYEVAKEKCEDLQGSAQSDCKKEAKMAEKAAIDAAKKSKG